jgi:hypothetical protein
MEEKETGERSLKGSKREPSPGGYVANTDGVTPKMGPAGVLASPAAAEGAVVASRFRESVEEILLDLRV